jgi:PKD repeat protein
MRRIFTLFSFILFLGFINHVSAQTYCTPTYASTCCMGFTNVSFGTINNSNAQYGSGYENYTATVAPAIVNPGRTYTLSYTSVSYDMYIQAWIDYNCDGDFTDAGELVYTTMPGYLAPGTYSTNITIPVTASSGTSRLRISGQYYATTPTTNPCGAFYYGDVEDYKLTILPIVGFDCALTSIDSPAVIGVGNNDLVVTFENKKADSVYWLDLGYQVDNNTPQIVYDYNINNGALLGAGESHQYKFPTPLNIPAKGSYTIKVWVSNVNDSIPDNDPSNDTIIWQACTGMYGTYTIGGTNPDFVDFSEAVAALQQCGISDPVRFDVRPGTYTETITIPEILGASQVNTITFDGNDMNSVKLTHAGTSTQKATIVLDGADYITFQDMTIENIGTTYAIGVFLKGSADFNTIKDCHVDVTKETSTTASEKLPIIASDSWDYSAWSQYGNNAEYTTIEGNHITGGRIGVTFAGGSQTNLCVGNKIIGNHIEDQFDYGTLMYFQFNAEISNNVIENFVNIDARGIGMNNYNSGSKINANIIHPGQYGIYLWYENYSNTTATTYVTNNIISDFKNTQYQRGITTSNGTSGSYSYNLHIYHNSIHVDGSAASWWYYAAISLYYPYSPVIKNNILATTGGNILLSFYGSPNSNATVDNNLYYYPNRPSTYYLFYNNGWFRDVASWKTQTYRINSPHDVYSLDNVNPRFVSNTNLHLDPTYQPVKTDIITGYNVMYDVDGDLRCPYEATIGADESSFPISKPTSNFTSEDTICFGSPITFLNTADPAAKQGYKWYLNGNLESTDRIWTYTFGAGTYVDTIMLVTANCGGADTFTKIVTIDAPQSKPGADFLSDLNYIETYYPVNFSDLTVDCPSSWTWSVYPASVSINGIPVPTTQFISSTSNSQNPTISFDYPGKYTVCLTAANVVGADSICKDDYINVKPSQWMCQYVLPEVEEALSGFLFDDGGPFNNYADGNTTCEITLRPCADTITLTFSEFNVATGDYLRIFEGTDNTGRPLWDQTTFPLGLTGVLPVGVSFTSNTGKMFIEWQTDASGNAPGFAAEWNSVQGTSTAPIADFMVDDTVCAGASFAFENLSTGDDLKYEWYFDM